MIYENYTNGPVNDVDGWCTKEKADFLYAFVKDHPELKTIVEIGVYGGKSLFPMGIACKENESGRVIGIDPWSKSANIEGSLNPADIEWWGSLDIEAIHKKFVQNALNLDILEYVYWLRLKSEEAVTVFENQSIDLIHQDGNHSPEVSYQEIKMWYPKLKKNGIWIIDDINWPTTKNAVDWLNQNLQLVYMTEGWAVYLKV